MFEPSKDNPYDTDTDMFKAYMWEITQDDEDEDDEREDTLPESVQK